MVDLEKSEYFDKVELLFSKQQMKEKVKLQNFNLSAQLSDPLKLKDVQEDEDLQG